MRALIALAAPAIAGAFMIAAPSGAAPLSLAQPVAASDVLQVQYGYGERREERGYGERRRDDGDRWRERREYRGDGDDWRRRAWKRRVFCRMHPDVC
jgi:hypothetical protein